jgi:hypothetical protein
MLFIAGISKRILHRKLEKGEIRKAHRNIPGRKPFPILHPEDIDTLTAPAGKPPAAHAERVLITSSSRSGVSTRS